MRRLSVVLMLCALLQGCSALCVQLGFGLGVGAAVEVPLLMHAGVHVGGASYFGWGYERGFHGPDRKTSNTTLIIYHSEEERFEDGRVKDRHACFAMFAPFIYDIFGGNRIVESTGLEVTVSGLLFSLRFGLNPGYWFTDDPEEEPAPAPPPDPEGYDRSDHVEPQASSADEGD